jgi:tetratricopeptide (TPR) repeat protein
MKNFILACIFLSLTFAFTQNCEAYKYQGDTSKYKACIIAKERAGHYQFSKAYQTAMDQALEIDSTYAYAYFGKSVAYLKSGDFMTWKALIDKAVFYDPEQHLWYRGWCRFQFFRDYKGAIQDIEEFDRLVDDDIGQSQNGVYHLNIAKGLCYKGIGEYSKAIEILEKQIQINEKDSYVGAYDYLHLGVLYLESRQFQKAVDTFNKQSEANELAENQYYLALAYLELDKRAQYRSGLEQAKKLYLEKKRMYDSYTTPMDKIYLKDIETEIQKADTKNS